MKTNQELLDEANKIDFKIKSNGALNSRLHTTQERGLFFIRKAIEIHGIDKYQYGLVQYVDNSTKVELVCPIHGSFFIQPDNHHMGKGCAKCANKYTPTTEEWVEKAKKVHGDLYDYSRVVYKKSREKVTLICKIHGPFEQTPNNHINYFSGCPKCAGHNQNILYLVMCKDTGWYKIGITTSNVNSRMTSIGGNVEEIFHIICEDPRKHETYLHKLYEKDREYNPCVKSGNTEFFSLNEDQVKQIIDYMSSIANN